MWSIANIDVDAANMYADFSFSICWVINKK